MNFLKTVGETWLRVLHTQTQQLARQHQQKDTDITGLLMMLLTVEVTLVLIEPFKGCKCENRLCGLQLQQRELIVSI